MKTFDWQTWAVILIISVTLAIFLRRFFTKKSRDNCGGGCHCPSKKSTKD